MEDHIVFIFYIFTFLFSTIDGFLIFKIYSQRICRADLVISILYFILSLIYMITIFLNMDIFIIYLFTQLIDTILVNIFKDKKTELDL